MKNYIYLILASILLMSCMNEDVLPNRPYNGTISGLVQKGPFVSGTSIQMNELNSNLVQTGKVFNSSIRNDLGSFEMNNIELTSNFAEFTASGFYFNEVTGEITSTPLTLTTLSDVTDRSSVNVNVLTHLEKNRVEKLIKQGVTFSQAKTQARNELLSLFSFELNNNSSFEDFDISKDSDEGGILLAVSILLQGNRNVGQLTELLARIREDFSDNGVLDNNTLKEELVNTTLSLNLEQIRLNVQTRFNQLNITTPVPNFEKFINDFEASVFTNENFFLAENGVTCMCPNAQPGERGVINGVVYEAVDNNLLRQRVLYKTDLTRVCTSLVTDMHNLFSNYIRFNQNINHWDVSNVVTMNSMFTPWFMTIPGSAPEFTFDQPLDMWNVANVEDMDLMFFNTPYNRNLSNWCVSKIESEPVSFSSNMSEQNKPVWGTCPQ